MKYLQVTMITFAICCSSLALAVAKPLSPVAQSAFLKKMQANLDGVKTVKMKIQQKRVLKLFMDELKADGIFYFELPGKLRWEITAPYKSVIIYNNRQVGKFEYRDETWNKLNFGASDLMAEVMSNILDWSQGKFDSSKDVYSMQAFDNNKIILTPRSKELAKNLQAIELSLDSKTLKVQRVTLKEAKGDYVEISFSNFEENSQFNPKLFDTKQPSI